MASSADIEARRDTAESHPSKDIGETEGGLAALVNLDTEALLARYRSAPIPESTDHLNGPLPGHLLTFSGALGRGRLARVVGKIASLRGFPWEGKAFDAASPTGGSGGNRVRLLGERTWFHFETRLGSSSIDGRPCVILDYNQPSNPWPIRQVRDELRELEPGVWAGPALVWGKVVLFFAVTVQ